MTICIGFDGTPLLGPRAGVGNYTGRLLAAMLATNPEWEYLLYSNRPLEPLETELADCRRVISRIPTKRLIWMQCLLPGLIQRSRPQLCHFPNAMAPLWQPQPFVLTIHDASLFLFSDYHPRARLLSLRLALPLVARRAAAVITVSHHARQELISILNLDSEKVHVVHEAAPAAFERVTDGDHLAALRRKYRLPDRFLLHVGTLEPRKNLRRLVRALSQVRRRGHDVSLVLVGARGWHMNGFQAEIESLSMSDAVLFTGYVPDEDLPGLFSLATLFVYPSLYEGFGLPPIEAMACGTPVLASNRGSLPEVCGEAAHLVDPEDEQALVEALVALLGDAGWREELGRRGPARAWTFSWERAARETTAIYRRVMAESGH
jgi:glycosyltransferase involved in cell wall biosynthesis